MKRTLILITLAAAFLLGCIPTEPAQRELSAIEQRQWDYAMQGSFNFDPPADYALDQTLTQGKSCTTANGTKVEAQTAGLLINARHVLLSVGEEMNVDGVLFINRGNKIEAYATAGQACVQNAIEVMR